MGQRVPRPVPACPAIGWPRCGRSPSTHLPGPPGQRLLAARSPDGRLERCTAVANAVSHEGAPSSGHTRVRGAAPTGLFSREMSGKQGEGDEQELLCAGVRGCTRLRSPRPLSMPSSPQPQPSSEQAPGVDLAVGPTPSFLGGGVLGAAGPAPRGRARVHSPGENLLGVSKPSRVLSYTCAHAHMRARACPRGGPLQVLGLRYRPAVPSAFRLTTPFRSALNPLFLFHCWNFPETLCEPPHLTGTLSESTWGSGH